MLGILYKLNICKLCYKICCFSEACQYLWIIHLTYLGKRTATLGPNVGCFRCKGKSLLVEWLIHELWGFPFCSVWMDYFWHLWEQWVLALIFALACFYAVDKNIIHVLLIIQLHPGQGNVLIFKFLSHVDLMFANWTWTLGIFLRNFCLVCILFQMNYQTLREFLCYSLQLEKHSLSSSRIQK